MGSGQTKHLNASKHVKQFEPAKRKMLLPQLLNKDDESVKTKLEQGY